MPSTVFKCSINKLNWDSKSIDYNNIDDSNNDCNNSDYNSMIIIKNSISKLTQDYAVAFQKIVEAWDY